MASTYTQNNGIEKIADGDQSAIWGQTTNNNFDLIDRAVNGVGFVAVASTAVTLTTSDGLLTDGLYAALVFTGGAGSPATVTIAPDTAQKTYFVRNATSQNLVFTQGTGATVTISAGGTAAIACTGSGPTSSVFDMTALLNTATSANTASTIVRRDATGGFSGTLTGSVTGNAGTATKLQVARTIGGVGFDGSASINLPGVNVVGNQNTTGTAAGITGLTAAVAELNTLVGINPTGSGFGYVPSGGIIIWSGSVASVPTGWFLCNGANGTPDLRNRFVVGAGDTYAVAATGGAADVTLTEAQLPAHAHGDGTLATASDGGHRHYVLNQDSQGSFGGWVNSFLAKRNGAGGSENYNLNGTNTEPNVGLTSENGTHTHDITGSTGSTGSGEAVATLPPYYALAYIMKA